jgi:hypothetical protein
MINQKKQKVQKNTMKEGIKNPIKTRNKINSRNSFHSNNNINLTTNLREMKDIMTEDKMMIEITLKISNFKINTKNLITKATTIDKMISTKVFNKIINPYR